MVSPLGKLKMRANASELTCNLTQQTPVTTANRNTLATENNHYRHHRRQSRCLRRHRRNFGHWQPPPMSPFLNKDSFSRLLTVAGDYCVYLRRRISLARLSVSLCVCIGLCCNSQVLEVFSQVYLQRMSSYMCSFVCFRLLLRMSFYFGYLFWHFCSFFC